MVTAIQGLKLSGVFVVRTDHTEQSLLVIIVCSGMCLGAVHFFAKVSLRILSVWPVHRRGCSEHPFDRAAASGELGCVRLSSRAFAESLFAGFDP